MNDKNLIPHALDLIRTADPREDIPGSTISDRRRMIWWLVKAGLIDKVGGSNSTRAHFHITEEGVAKLAEMDATSCEA